MQQNLMKFTVMDKNVSSSIFVTYKMEMETNAAEKGGERHINIKHTNVYFGKLLD